MLRRMAVDNKVCTGCRYCEVVCSMGHSDGVINPGEARIKVRVDTLNGTAVTVVCRQCKNPKCVEACPHYALRQEPIGVPVVDPARCAGASCLACLEACPYGAMFYDQQEGIPTVCDLCAGDPLCVKFCRAYPHRPHAALRYG